MPRPKTFTVIQAHRIDKTREVHLIENTALVALFTSKYSVAIFDRRPKRQRPVGGPYVNGDLKGFSNKGLAQAEFNRRVKALTPKEET